MIREHVEIKEFIAQSKFFFIFVVISRVISVCSSLRCSFSDCPTRKKLELITLVGYTLDHFNTTMKNIEGLNFKFIFRWKFTIQI